MNLLLEQLQSIINAAQHINTPRDFFPLLYEFGKLVLCNPDLGEIINSIQQEELGVTTKLKQIKKYATNELKQIAKKISLYIRNKKNIDPEIQHDLDNFKSKIDNNIESAFYSLESALFLLLHDESDNHSLFLKKIGKIQQINAYKFFRTEDAFPKFNNWRNTDTYIAQQKRISSSFSLNQIMGFFERYDWQVHDHIKGNLTKKGINTKQFTQEHIELMRYSNSDGTKIPESSPTIREYKNYMRRVFFAIKKLILSTSKEIINQSLFKYNYKDIDGVRTGTLYFNKQTCTLTGKSAMLLQLIAKNKGSHLAKDEAGNYIDDGSTTTNKQVDNAIRVIKNNIENTFKINDFFNKKPHGFIQSNYDIRLI